jgi:hypothetical protein
MWLALCASDEQVARFWAGDNPPAIDALLEQLESKPSFSEGVLSQIKREHWGTLCGFTHTGGCKFSDGTLKRLLSHRTNRKRLRKCCTLLSSSVPLPLLESQRLLTMTSWRNECSFK